MRKFIFLPTLVCIIGLLSCKNSFGQSAIDSNQQKTPLNNARAVFNAAIGEQSPLFNGPEYYFYSPVIKGNAYLFDVNSFMKGAVLYDGVQYKEVPLMYDLYKDELVALLYNNFSKYILLKGRVQHFDLLDHHFVNINTDTLNINSPIKSGYYDELYNGKTQVLVKREKSIQNRNNGIGVPETYFNPTTDFYMKKGITYYVISSENGLLNVLKDRKKDVQQYIKTNKIKFRRDPEQAMVKIASYYDHLTN
jgi:hypothetical protein